MDIRGRSRGGKGEKMKLQCKNPKCKRKWEYKGEKKFYTTCPDCKTSVKIPETNDENEDE